MQENQTNSLMTTSTAKTPEQAGQSSLMRRLRQPLRRGVEGQALVEFALSLPFLVMLFVVLVETGFLLRSHIVVTDAASEGVRVSSGRGNADPSFVYNRNNANEVANRVGADADFVLAQNVNTALESERANVTMLMSYRADPSEGTSIAQNGGPPNAGPLNTIGVYGLGGAYGVYYNTNVSKYPFFEVFTYTLKANASGVAEKWFSSTVMSVGDCYNQYNANPSQVMIGQSNTVGTYSSPMSSTSYFCGDATKNDYSLKPSGGISRQVRLGQYDPSPTVPNTNDNFANIKGMPQFNGNSSEVCSGSYSSGPPSDGIAVKVGTTPPPPLLRCWRYNFAPWYPSLRRATDVAFNPNNVDSTTGDYYNYNFDNPKTFGDDTKSDRSPDYTGVRIDYQHKSFLQYIPFNLSLSDKAVKIIDPIGGGFQN